MPSKTIADGSTPSAAAVVARNAAANAIAVGLVAISSGVSQQSSKAVGCTEAANSGVTLRVVPPPIAAPAQPGSSSPSVEMPLSTMSSGDTPSAAAVVSRNAAANAIAAGLVNISSGVNQQSSNAVGCSEPANSSET